MNQIVNIYEAILQENGHSRKFLKEEIHYFGIHNRWFFRRDRIKHYGLPWAEVNPEYSEEYISLVLAPDSRNIWGEYIPCPFDDKFDDDELLELVLPNIHNLVAGIEVDGGSHEMEIEYKDDFASESIVFSMDGITGFKWDYKELRVYFDPMNCAEVQKVREIAEGWEEARDNSIEEEILRLRLDLGEYVDGDNDGDLGPYMTSRTSLEESNAHITMAVLFPLRRHEYVEDDVWPFDMDEGPDETWT